MGQSIPLILENPSISPRYRVSDWRRAMESDDWTLRIDIFKDRITGRFLEPIELIEKDVNIGNFAGFSIMALDCLLVETLSQFYQGIDETPRDHQKQFWIFFRGSDYFKPHFTRRLAGIFYSHIRCGLLHQAQTKNGTLIRADQETMIKSASGAPANGIIVDRIRFHDALKKEISTYISKLKMGGNHNAQLRENFIKKMQCICGIQP